MESDHQIIPHTLVPIDSHVIEKSQFILQSALEEKHLSLHIETPKTCKELQGLSPSFVSGLEKLIISIYESGDEELRLLSVRDTKTGLPVGFIFWRNLEQQEMAEWIKSSYQDQYNKPKRKELTEKKIIPIHESVNILSLSQEIIQNKKLPTTGWIKIELMCVSQQMQGQHIGTMLLAAALFYCYFQESKTHAVLQVAGGKTNTRAIELYKKFNFGPADEYFEIPNDNIMVLWEIEKMIQGLHWNEFTLSSHTKKTIEGDSK